MNDNNQPVDGRELRKVIDVLTGEYANLRWIWQEFLELYARDGNRIDMMNDIAPGFFAMVQSLMIEAMVIRLCRMTDGEGSGKRANLPLGRILRELPVNVREHADEIEGLIYAAEALVECVRPWRNQRLAHLDFNHVMSEGSQKFSIGYTELRKSIEAIHTVLDRTSVIAWDTALCPEVVPTTGKAASLMRTLETHRPVQKRQ